MLVFVGREHCRLISTEAVQQEALLMPKVLQHLIRRDGAFVVIDNKNEMDRNEGEEEADFNLRKQRERIIGLHPDYAPE